MPISRSSRIRIAITMGDPAGIGPEVVAKSLPHLTARKAEYIIIGDLKAMQASFKKLNLRFSRIRFIDLGNVDARRLTPGKASRECGKASLEYLDTAVELLDSGKAEALVTAPVSKEALSLAGCGYTGHTEYLSRYAREGRAVMMLMNGKLKFSLATRHIPLRQVADKLDPLELAECIKITNSSLRRLFKIRSPRIAVCALNPHASDNGLIGDEEARIIAPAMRSLRIRGCRIYGPLPADTAVRQALSGEYDCLIALYHDQALIPLKATDADGGVNVTLGLGFVRTSPLHGTAFDIAGKNRASYKSFLEAVNVAVVCALNRRKA